MKGRFTQISTSYLSHFFSGSAHLFLLTRLSPSLVSLLFLGQAISPWVKGLESDNSIAELAAQIAAAAEF
jgi:hypothetical protein